MSPLDLAVPVATVVLGVAFVLTVLRMVRGPSAADRVVALDLVGLLGVAAAVLAAFHSGSIVFVDIALGVALVGFVAAVAFAAFIERGSLREPTRQGEGRD